MRNVVVQLNLNKWTFLQCCFRHWSRHGSVFARKIIALSDSVRKIKSYLSSTRKGAKRISVENAFKWFTWSFFAFINERRAVWLVDVVLSTLHSRVVCRCEKQTNCKRTQSKIPTRFSAGSALISTWNFLRAWHMHTHTARVERERDKEGEKVRDDVLHARIRCQRLFVCFFILLSARRTSTVIFELSYRWRCSHSYTLWRRMVQTVSVVTNISKLKRRKKKIFYEFSCANTRVDQNKLFAFFSSDNGVVGGADAAASVAAALQYSTVCFRLICAVQLSFDIWTHYLQ